MGLKINLICVGTLKEGYLKEAVREYEKRLQSYCKLKIVEVKEGRDIDKEGEGILSKVPSRSYLIALDILGRELSSVEFAEKLDGLPHRGVAEVSLVIGGSDGLSEKVLSASDFRLSFSRMTFPHQLMRVILLEQLYRAFKINSNEVYHK